VDRGIIYEVLELIITSRKASEGANFIRGYSGYDYRNDALNERESKTMEHKMRIPLDLAFTLYAGSLLNTS
jgi:hypothetical protein